MTGFPRSPRECDCSDTDLHNLIDAGLLADPSAPTDEHPWAKRLFVQFKAGGDKLTKIDAYAIGNELNRQAARIRELENGGRTYLRESPDDGGAALPADLGQPACRLECDMLGVAACEARSADGWFCTRNDGHEGEHVACSEFRHGCTTWTDEQPLDSKSREIEDAIDDDLDAGRGR